jgi:hypothetical protein
MKTKFPGFAKCMELVRKHNPQLQEDGFALLRPHAHEYVGELIEEFQRESKSGLRCWILELLCEARSPKTVPLFIDVLSDDDENLWSWAICGLHELNSKEARLALWEARSYAKATDDQTAYFRRLLDVSKEEL